MLRSSEDAEEKLTSDCIGKESRNNPHHCPTTVVTLDVLLGRIKTLTVVVFDYHLGFFSEQIVLPQFVCCYGHCSSVKNCYII